MAAMRGLDFKNRKFWGAGQAKAPKNLFWIALAKAAA
jgi:hypothetical protein